MVTVTMWGCAPTYMSVSSSPPPPLVEAPPSYLQLFGKDDEETDGSANQRRRQRRSRERREGRDWSDRIINLIPHNRKETAKFCKSLYDMCELLYIL